MAAMSQKISIEVKRDDRLYEFEMPFGSPCGEAYDACHEVLQELVKISQQAADRAKPEVSQDNKEAKQ